ncbi:hypothetical protein ANCCAN_08922 [Ancylostoma caninum]|uniref:Uncharacterized protein n=1 Tax=Ancylostoma caninum TaxID=29170 RepID=A0A368GQ65_ANCCA|nr:hypothetical protein ANCCAN_08922 [Ancylostoma caninum]
MLEKVSKDFRETTIVDGDGYPKYKRPDNGRSVEIGGETFDNRHIVPYNRYLSLLLNAHINLEICGYIQAVKYLYKLQVHLPGFQTVAFLEGEEREALQREAEKDTTLTAWFKLNLEYERLQDGGADLQGGVDSRTLYYYQLPEHFTFVKQTRKWKIRARGTRQIGRMFVASPRDPERFSLRLLLLHRKNAHSFEHLRTVNGVVYNTFGDAARALDLLYDDAHYALCLEEAATFQVATELRALFSYMLAFCDIRDPQTLFDRFKASMAENFVHRGYSQLEGETMA